MKDLPCTLEVEAGGEEEGVVAVDRGVSVNRITRHCKELIFRAVLWFTPKYFSKWLKFASIVTTYSPLFFFCPLLLQKGEIHCVRRKKHKIIEDPARGKKRKSERIFFRVLES